MFIEIDNYEKMEWCAVSKKTDEILFHSSSLMELNEMMKNRMHEVFYFAKAVPENWIPQKGRGRPIK